MGTCSTPIRFKVYSSIKGYWSLWAPQSQRLARSDTVRLADNGVKP